METGDCRGEKAAAVAGSSQCTSRVEPGETFHFKEFDVKSLNVIFVFLSLKKTKKTKHTIQGFAETRPGSPLLGKMLVCNDVTSVKPHVVVHPLGPRYSQQTPALPSVTFCILAVFLWRQHNKQEL